MKLHHLPLAALMTLSSCGIYQWWDVKEVERERTVASLTVQQIVGDSEASFREELSEKLSHLHHYYVFAQKFLAEFDQNTSSLTSGQLYQSEAYLSLLAIHGQIQDIEEDLSKLNRNKIVKEAIKNFAKRGAIQSSSMENISYKMGIETNIGHPSRQQVLAELKILSTHKEFLIFEKNIEHLAHVSKTLIERNDEKNKLTGDNFPSKVWSLTFYTQSDLKKSMALKIINEQNIQGTFFTFNGEGKMAGPGISREIARAAKKVTFFRYPYGHIAGYSHSRIKKASSEAIYASWNVDSLDWIPQSSDKIVARTTLLMGKTNKDSGIILFHDTHKRSTMALPKIISYVKSNQRRTCSLERIVTDMNEGLPVVCAPN